MRLKLNVFKWHLEGMMLKLKLQYFGHLMRRVDSLEKTLMLGGIGGRGEGDDRGWDGWMASQTRWTWVWVNSRSWRWRGRPGVLRFMGSQRVGHDWATDLIWSEQGHRMRNFLWNPELNVTILLFFKFNKNHRWCRLSEWEMKERKQSGQVTWYSYAWFRALINSH